MSVSPSKLGSPALQPSSMIDLHSIAKDIQRSEMKQKRGTRPEMSAYGHHFILDEDSIEDIIQPTASSVDNMQQVNILALTSDQKRYLVRSKPLTPSLLDNLS